MIKNIGNVITIFVPKILVYRFVCRNRNSEIKLQNNIFCVLNQNLALECAIQYFDAYKLQILLMNS